MRHKHINMDAMASVIFRAITKYRRTLLAHSTEARAADRLLLDLTPVNEEDPEIVVTALEKYVRGLPVTNPDVSLGISTLKYLKTGSTI